MGIILLAAALLPAIALMIYVHARDRVEREPMGLVLRVFLIGAASGLVAAFIETILIDLLYEALPEGPTRIVIEYFICVAAVEEACKYFALNTVRNNPDFDYLFDAVVYSVAAALGFAALENVFYVLDGGLGTAVVRAVLSVPGHAADGVVMGVFYGLALQRKFYGKSGSGLYFFLAFLLPTIEHGFYDAALSTESDGLAGVAVLFDLAFIGLAYLLVKYTAAKDSPLRPRRVAPSFPQAPGTNWAGGASQPPLPMQVYPMSQPDYRMPQQHPMPQTGQAPSPYPAGQAVQAIPGDQANQAPFLGQGVPYGQSAAAPTNAGMPVVAATMPSEMWVCPSCGALAENNFCGNCGKPRESSASAE